MCRIAAYSGPAIPLENIIVRPAHSLLDQSQHASEAKLPVNGDGFGIAWYGDDDRPGLYRDVLPAWADGNLTSLCRMVLVPIHRAHPRQHYGRDEPHKLPSFHPWQLGVLP